MRLLIVRLCSDRSLFRPRTLVLGKVEVRGRRCDTARERAALLDSMAKCGLSSQVEVCPRLATVVEGPTIDECRAAAEVRFEEALDILDQEGFGMAKFSLLEAGFYREFEGTAVVPLIPPEAKGLPPNVVFHVTPEETPVLGFTEFVANHPGGELRSRFLRSAHWSRRSRWEPDLQLRVLFRWFAIEAACKVDKEFEVAPVVAAALGFPMKTIWNSLQGSTRDGLLAHPRYSSWRSQVHNRLRDLERWRNDSVHSGFRPWDISAGDLRAFDMLSNLGSARVQSLVREALVAAVSSAGDFALLVPTLIDLEAGQYVNDVHGTVIYSLEHP